MDFIKSSQKKSFKMVIKDDQVKGSFIEINEIKSLGFRTNIIIIAIIGLK